MKYRKVVGVILLNEHGEVLLQLRDDKPELRYAGYWTFFGGAVEAGEEPDDAIMRELQEELEIQPEITFWLSYECPARTVAGEVVTTNYMYVGKMTEPLENLVLHEGQAMRYFTQEDAEQLDLAFMQTSILARFYQEMEKFV